MDNCQVLQRFSYFTDQRFKIKRSKVYFLSYYY